MQAVGRSIARGSAPRTVGTASLLSAAVAEASVGRRFAGGQGVHHSKAIEQWAYMRENTHQTFAFNKKTATIGLVFGVMTPIAVYKLCVSEQEKHDERLGRDQDYM